MKLLYNNVDLAQLGALRIVSHQTQREPAEAPQWERVTYKVRLDFFQQTFQDNFTLVEQLRATLKTQQAQLLWQEENGSEYVNRTVTAGEDESTDEGLNRGGTRWQALTFTFWFVNHDVTSNCLAARYQRTGTGTPNLNLDAVTQWNERLNIARWDDLRDARKVITGTVAAAGRFRGDTKTALADRRTALLAVKDQFVSEIQRSASGTLSFGSFSRSVRISEFKADIDQPNNAINWSFTAVYTVFPNEADYAFVEVKITRKENLAEGIAYLSLTGKVGAPDAAKANARIALLIGSLRPAGYVTLATETGEPRMATESDGNTANTGDGFVVVETTFQTELRDTSSIVCSYQRSGVSTPLIDLGTVDKFRDGYSAQLFDEMRSVRKHAGGSVVIGGKWYVADTLSDAAKQEALVERKRTFDTELTAAASGELIYGTVDPSNPNKLIFRQTVRVRDFSAEINRLRNCIEWSLTASFTRFPNEADYLVCEFKVGTRQDRTEGTKTMTITGRIGATTPEAARAKLVALRATLIPAGYVLKVDGSEETRVESNTGGNAVDGQAFTELTLNEEWQAVSGNVLSHQLRATDDDDARSGWLRTSYAGTVVAAGANSAAALATARARAASLGGGKYAFQVRTSVIEISHQVLTDGSVILAVEFTYEYLRKGAKIFTEVVSELTEDTFGNSVEAVTGFIAAPTLAVASATYQNEVRNISAYSGALLLNERRPTLAQQRLSGATALDDRYSFSFQVLRPKSGAQTSMLYEISTVSDLQSLEKRITVQGEVFAASEAVAQAFLDAFLTGLIAGKRLRFERKARSQQAPSVSGSSPVTVFTGLVFTEEWVALLTGVVSGILESECTEEVTYSGARIVEKPLPDAVSIIQQPGTTPGERTVTARCRATTETSGVAWVKLIRSTMLDPSGYERPPRIAISFRFLEQTAGVPRGANANVKVYEVSGTFSQVIPSLPFPA